MSEGWEDCEWKHWPCLSCHFSRLSEDSIVSGSLSFPLPPVQDVLSASVATNRRHQSHWLRNHLLPISPLLWRQLLELVSQICSSVCSASKDIYLHTVTTTHTHRHKETNAQKICPSLYQDQKGPQLNLSLSCFLYPSLYVVGCWIYSDRIHLMSSMFPELTVFIRELRAHHATYTHVHYWM